MNEIPIIWTSKTTYVDIDTAEIITKHNREQNYHIIKTSKNVILNTNKTRGLIEYTVQCRWNTQLNLFETH